MEPPHGASITLKIAKNELKARKLQPPKVVRGVIFIENYEPNSS
jgi:hypothetical protein